MIKVIRYANEGFQNYTHKAKVNNEIVDVVGCFAFVNKAIPKALTYDRDLLKTTKKPIRNRNKDVKNIGYATDDTYVYARMIDPEKLDYRVSTHPLSAGVFVQPESLANIDEESMVRVKLCNFIDNLKRYELFKKKLNKMAKENNVKVYYLNNEYYFYEVIINKEDVAFENNLKVISFPKEPIKNFAKCI